MGHIKQANEGNLYAPHTHFGAKLHPFGHKQTNKEHINPTKRGNLYAPAKK